MPNGFPNDFWLFIAALLAAGGMHVKNKRRRRAPAAPPRTHGKPPKHTGRER